jgi:hypothetical protein
MSSGPVTLASARWVSRLWRSSCSVHPPVAARKSSAARRYERHPRPVLGVHVVGARRLASRCGAMLAGTTGPSSDASVAREQSGRCRLPADRLSVATLADHHRSLVGRVEVLDIEQEDLLGPGRGLVEHAPQQPFPQTVVRRGEERLEFLERNGPGAVDVRAVGATPSRVSGGRTR